VPELDEQLQSLLGTTYLLEHELGGGGMSRVFVASEQALGRKVVIKVLKPELAEGLSGERFKREVRLAARLQHPHIVPLLAAGALSDDVLYYTMPFVAGESLRSRLEREGPLPVAEIVRIGRDVASALAYAHRLAVVHRDVKPANILLSDGGAVVADFGIAKAIHASREAAGDDARRPSTLTAAGTSLGTPAYMAPEQAAGDAVDHRADLYALGVVLYEMLAGRPPFEGRSMQRMLAAHAIDPPEPIERRRRTRRNRHHVSCARSFARSASPVSSLHRRISAGRCLLTSARSASSLGSSLRVAVTSHASGQVATSECPFVREGAFTRTLLCLTALS
jgi:serine/threonine-protein kinase